MGCGGGFGRMGGLGAGMGRGWFGGRQMSDQDPAPRMAPMDDEDPESILKRRLARGEITIDEYRALRDTLKETAS